MLHTDYFSISHWKVKHTFANNKLLFSKTDMLNSNLFLDLFTHMLYYEVNI